MFDIVAPDQHQPPTSIHCRSIDHRQARHPPASGVGAEAVARESANQPGRHPDQREDGHERKEKGHCLHACPRPITLVVFIVFRSSRADKKRRNGRRKP